MNKLNFNSNFMSFVLFITAISIIMALPSLSIGKAIPKTSQVTSPLWQKRCVESSSKNCEVFQSIVMRKNNLRIVEVALSKNGKKSKMGVVLPLGITVSSGIALTVDGGKPIKTPVDTCNVNGCVSFVDVPESFIKQMKKGKMLEVYFFDGKKTQAKIQLSLSGFSKALRLITL